jgi:Carboxypeptidase regulatory-like domain
MVITPWPSHAQDRSQPTIRTLNGTVSDTSHEPIRGAVVELHNSKSAEVLSYLTDASGQYNFKRLDGNTDYDVWVLYRGRRSPTRSISKFDSHMAKVIDFTIRTY